MSGLTCSTALCSALLETVIPSVGVALAVAICLSPFRQVYTVVQSGSASQVNTSPYAWLVANAIAWSMYGAFLGDPFVFAPNIAGFHLGLWYTFSTFPTATPALRKQAMTVIIGASLLVFTGAFVSFTILKGRDPAKIILGSIAVTILAVFYGSPLTDAVQVIRARDASSINPILATTSFLNGCLWTVYGIVIADPFVWGPNALGVVLSMAQLVLLAIFGRGKAHDAEDVTTDGADKNGSLDGLTTAIRV
ncbi:sugar efflux transporter for intercellular exchange-domain-containing protein [Entophlyctis helioformis]|nr:sugar efflux transporter for intercellular exchange-domain-containing protein [Entophlyctis helioformis]